MDTVSNEELNSNGRDYISAVFALAATATAAGSVYFAAPLVIANCWAFTETAHFETTAPAADAGATVRPQRRG
jgi:hypothetical protein